MNRVMLRFRPIAPKPAAGGSGSDGSSMDNKNAFFAKGRTKRKYVRVRKNNNSSSSSNSSGYKRERKIGEEEKKEGSLELENRVVTLQLLPEKSERNESLESGSWCNFDDEENGDPPELPMWLNKFDDNKGVTVSVSSGDEKDHTAAVESWVTVESVTDTCMGVGQLGSTDEERMRNLEEDTCPGFVSDGLDRVMWVNRAFKRMLVRKEQNDRQSAENNSNNKMIMVWLVGKEKLKLKLPYLDEAEAFTCQVKLQHTCGTEKKDNKCSQIVPCDVWRMDGGGFAWRLDVEAALSLGR